MSDMSDAGEDLAYLAAKLARLEVDLAEARAALLLIAKDAPSICALLMRELLHADALPLALRQMRDGTATVEQITALAADEIERLRAERDEARADESFAAALKAAREDIVR